MQVPLDPKIRNLAEIPYTISFVIRKRQQIDNLNELTKDKRPPESMIWDGTAEDIEEWLDKVFDSKKKGENQLVFDISKNDIEGA